MQRNDERSHVALQGFVSSPDHEASLLVELGPATAAAGRGGISRPPRWPGLITTFAGMPTPDDPVFARQRLPAATLIKAESVRGLAEAAFQEVAPAVDAAGDEVPLVLHAFVPDPGRYRNLAGRAALVGEALRGAIQERRRRWLRRLLAPEEAVARAHTPAWGEVIVVQAALVGRTSLLVSAARPRALPHGGFDLAPWPAGLAPVAEDRRAPSRAYGKLEEGFAWLGTAPAPGELCVDLGGAPGGWAWRALARGARVVAVDRAPLEPPAAGHPALTMVVGNAFTHEPETPADWLLCDVICEPARTIALVERWLERRWARRVVATVKFKGTGGYRVLDPVPARLAALGARFVRIKHLHRHHNEVAILARAD